MLDFNAETMTMFQDENTRKIGPMSSNLVELLTLGPTINVNCASRL